MSALVLTGMVACFVLLVVSVVAYRASTVSPEPDHSTDCRHCAALRHPSQLAALAALSTLPAPRGKR
ncbi:hypothetical protein ACGFR8_07575 [Streptomyces brevispora]|uniref:hypothetical protein n=1 Tax=Streptomyces brevispora TaxID=887462 RepID=UPI00371826A9